MPYLFCIAGRIKSAKIDSGCHKTITKMYLQILNNSNYVTATMNANRALSEFDAHKTEFSTICSAKVYDESIVFEYKREYLRFYIACFRAGLSEAGKKHVSKSLVDNLINCIKNNTAKVIGNKDNFIIDLIDRVANTIFKYTTLSSAIYSLIGFYEESEYLPENMVQSIHVQLEEYLEQYVNPYADIE